MFGPDDFKRTSSNFFQAILPSRALLLSRSGSPGHAVSGRLRRNEPEDDVAVALAGPTHGPQTVEDGRLDVDEPGGRCTGRKGASSGSIERISEGLGITAIGPTQGR
jgi:hypothetical protein